MSNDIVKKHIDIVENYRSRRNNSLFWLSNIGLMFLDIPYEHNIISRISHGGIPHNVINEEYDKAYKKLISTPMKAGLAHYILQKYTDKIVIGNKQYITSQTNKLLFEK